VPPVMTGLLAPLVLIDGGEAFDPGGLRSKPRSRWADSMFCAWPSNCQRTITTPNITPPTTPWRKSHPEANAQRSEPAAPVEAAPDAGAFGSGGRAGAAAVLSCPAGLAVDTGAGRVAGSAGAAFHPGADANSSAQVARATSERWDWEINRPRWRLEVGLAGRRATPERSHSDAAKVGRAAQAARRCQPLTPTTPPPPRWRPAAPAPAAARRIAPPTGNGPRAEPSDPATRSAPSGDRHRPAGARCRWIEGRRPWETGKGNGPAPQRGNRRRARPGCLASPHSVTRPATAMAEVQGKAGPRRTPPPGGRYRLRAPRRCPPAPPAACGPPRGR
jgi:hypothetical protein